MNDMEVAVMQDGGPILVKFYLEAVHDNAASIAGGHYVAKDVEYVQITPQGGNLIWTGKITDEHRRRFEPQYTAWKQGLEPPADGTPLRDWPPISPAQLKTMDAVHIRTVEGLAMCSDGVLQGAGMGAVAMREKARAWLEAAKGPGKVAEEISALKVRLQDMEAANERLREQNAELNSAVRAANPPKRGPGRPRKDAAA